VEILRQLFKNLYNQARINNNIMDNSQKQAVQQKEELKVMDKTQQRKKLRKHQNQRMLSQ